MSKKDAKGKELTFEKVADLYEGMSIWKVDIERCREQDKNARVMDKDTFDRLKLNIAGDKKLESLPFGVISTNPSGNKEFNIISGHHRVRAARSAELSEIFVLVTDEELTTDQIKSKQLAHNALAGVDDKQVLKELWDSIASVDAKIASGIRDSDFDNMAFKNVSVDDMSIDFDFKVIKFMFLSSQLGKLDALVAMVEAGDNVFIADHAKFDEFAKTIRHLSKNDNIRNIASLVDLMIRVTTDYIKENPKAKDGDETKTRKKIGFGAAGK